MNSRRNSFRRSQTLINSTNGSAPLTRKSDHNSIEFPTSPDASGEEINHFSHPHHPISLIKSPELFTCSGCKEQGAGSRFCCPKCDFQLHDFCAFSPPLLNAHPLHPQHQLLFHSKPKSGGIRWARCNVCGKSTKGFTFRCGFCHFQMHPCCAMLSDQINYSSLHHHPLNLLPPFAASDHHPSLSCAECKIKRSGRMYGCRACDYHLHAVCAKDMINGLKVNGLVVRNSERPSVLGPAVKLASQAVIEFIGGLSGGASHSHEGDHNLSMLKNLDRTVGQTGKNRTGS